MTQILPVIIINDTLINDRASVFHTFSWPSWQNGLPFESVRILLLRFFTVWTDWCVQVIKKPKVIYTELYKRKFGSLNCVQEIPGVRAIQVWASEVQLYIKFYINKYMYM